jgi:hypothetical protein
VGRLTVVDSSLGIPRKLFAESLTTCQFFNSANYTPVPQDTSVKIRFTVLNKDPSTVPDKCNGTHADSIPLQLAVP